MPPGEEFKRFEHAGWERAAPHYEACWASLTSHFVSPLIQAAAVGRGQRVLDVACGPGLVSEAASRLGAVTTGLDFSRRMVLRARERHPQLEFLEGDAERLPFDGAGFDAVLMNFGVPHLARPEEALREALRVLRPGGRFAFTVWADPKDNPGARIMSEAIDTHADLRVDLPEGPPRYPLSDAHQCREALATAGADPTSFAFVSLTAAWRVPTPSFLFEAERDGGVRTAGVLARQTAERLAAIRSAVERAVAQHAVPGGFAIPMTAHVVSAAPVRRG
ncbi:MAG: hypothetical protein AUI47_04240 [Acidobacteria bacterium 13_1_40CM_2_68_5]|nr:MAG: hypothetical protein AUI47_04240 [Acidobacteria bacterium 13_1_40CM_2_68_5]